MKEFDFNKNVIIYDNGKEVNDIYMPALKKLYEDVYKPYNIIMKTKNTPSIGCAQFIVSKKAIHKNPKDFYEKLYLWLIDNTNGEGSGDSNDLYSGYFTGRYLEWTWHLIFDKY